MTNGSERATASDDLIGNGRSDWRFRLGVQVRALLWKFNEAADRARQYWRGERPITFLNAAPKELSDS